MMYWQKDIETMSREELNKLQLERLKQTIELAGHSPFYSKVLKDNGITADSIQSLDDLQKIPFTTKDDLRNNYPFRNGSYSYQGLRKSTLFQRYNRKSYRRITFGKGPGPMGQSGGTLHVYGRFT